MEIKDALKQLPAGRFTIINQGGTPYISPSREWLDNSGWKFGDKVPIYIFNGFVIIPPKKKENADE